MTVVTLWGTRGSIAAPGPETELYGGNTSCIQITGSEGTVLVLDAGTGLRRLGRALPPDMRRVDILLTHLHMDHLQGLGFFGALRNPEAEVHIWGPASTTLNLQARLTRYLSPPFFPVLLRDLPRMPLLHEVPCAEFDVGEFHVATSLVNHPGPTVGYRIKSAAGVVAYLPDHEPALGVQRFPLGADWTSGYAVARDADLLIHDAQYTPAEYVEREGWGHSSLPQSFAFAHLAQVRRLVTFHHDPDHSDADLERITAEALEQARPDCAVTIGAEGAMFDIGIV
jgi:phosphoribosyl 1,2-cyclic phosphodiesterase